MSEMSEVFQLGAEDEARRIWEGAKAAQSLASESFVALCEALDLGLRAAEILITHRLQPVKAEFPATIGIHHVERWCATWIFVDEGNSRTVG